MPNQTSNTFLFRASVGYNQEEHITFIAAGGKCMKREVLDSFRHTRGCLLRPQLLTGVYIKEKFTSHFKLSYLPKRMYYM